MIQNIFRYDFLKIFESIDETIDDSNAIAMLTGVRPPNITSSGPEIYINFVSDSTETRPGFELYFQARM